MRLVLSCVIALAACKKQDPKPTSMPQVQTTIKGATPQQAATRPLLPIKEMLVLEYGHPSEQPAPADIKITPRPCKSLTLEAARSRNQGYTLANALLWLFSSTNIGQRQTAYRRLDEVRENINLHGADDFEMYDFVFCGEPWKIVARNIIHDATTNREMSEGWRQLARQAISHFDLKESLPLIEKRLAESTDQIELIQLVELWLNLQTRNRQDIRKHAPQLIAELESKIPRLKEFSVVGRALAYYQDLLHEDGCLCPPQDLLGRDFGRKEDKPRTNQDQEQWFFLDPNSECPPPSTLKEMQLDKCPFRSS